MAIYTINTTAEQDIALALIASAGKEQPQDVITRLASNFLGGLVTSQADGYVATIRANNGLQSLQALAQAPPNPNGAAK